MQADRATAAQPWGYIKAEVLSLVGGASLPLPEAAERFVIVTGSVRLSGPGGLSQVVTAGATIEEPACVELPSGGGLSLDTLSSAQLVLYSKV